MIKHQEFLINLLKNQSTFEMLPSISGTPTFLLYFSASVRASTLTQRGVRDSSNIIYL